MGCHTPSCAVSLKHHIDWFRKSNVSTCEGRAIVRSCAFNFCNNDIQQEICFIKHPKLVKMAILTLALLLENKKSGHKITLVSTKPGTPAICDALLSGLSRNVLLGRSNIFIWSYSIGSN